MKQNTTGILIIINNFFKFCGFWLKVFTVILLYLPRFESKQKVCKNIFNNVKMFSVVEVNKDLVSLWSERRTSWTERDVGVI